MPNPARSDCQTAGVPSAIKMFGIRPPSISASCDLAGIAAFRRTTSGSTTRRLRPWQRIYEGAFDLVDRAAARLEREQKIEKIEHVADGRGGKYFHWFVVSFCCRSR